MARSLFDELRARQAAPTAPPKLKPNAFARIARFAWRNAGFVIGFWFLLTLACAFGLWRNYAPPVAASLPLEIALPGDHTSMASFGTLLGMQTITLSNTRADLLEDQRSDVVTTMRQRGDIYQLVFAPGAGDYYDGNGFLYHPLDEVKGRVAYALSLKPLFTAIAEAPNISSMATLVTEISASLQQGRDPQGLDDLLSESAISVEAMMRGEDKPVDWSKLADLNEENTATTVTILAVPRAGQEAAARSLTLKLLNVLQNSSDTTGSLSQPGIPPPKRAAATVDGMRALAAAAIGVIFVALILALAFGRFRLVLAAFVPALAFLFPTALAVMLKARADWLAYWPFGLGLLWLAVALSLHTVLAKVTYANGRKARESVVMLADQHHGPDLAWLWLLLTLPFAGLVLLAQGTALALIALGLGAVAFALAITLPTALLRFIPEALQWRAGEWLVPAHRALFETGQWQWLARGLGALLVAVSAGYLALTPTRMEIRQADVPVSVVASNAADAEITIKRLKAFSEAKAVRWLGMFMPKDAEAKREAMSLLKDQFPRITPVLSEAPADIRDQLETLQDSLKEIASNVQAKPRLKMAADDFRRSLSLLAATSDDRQVRQLENRLFGGFNRLAERADLLAAVPPPQLATLPSELHTLFGTPEGAMRIEVTPVDGFSNAKLADILEQAGLNVLHPSVEQEQANRAVIQSVSKVLGLAAGIGLGVLLLALRQLRAIAAGLLMAVSCAVVAFAVGRFWQVEWNLTTLLQALGVTSALLAFVWPAARHEASTTTLALELFLLPVLAMVMVLPFDALGVAPIANATLPVASALMVAALIVGLLRQHRRKPEGFF